VICRVYNIKYKIPNSDLPTELTLDLSKYIPNLGLENLTSKVPDAIKETTGYEPESWFTVRER
jgi:hypothetical protein